MGVHEKGRAEGQGHGNEGSDARCGADRGRDGRRGGCGHGPWQRRGGRGPAGRAPSRRWRRGFGAVLPLAVPRHGASDRVAVLHPHHGGVPRVRVRPGAAPHLRLRHARRRCGDAFAAGPGRPAPGTAEPPPGAVRRGRGAHLPRHPGGRPRTHSGFGARGRPRRRRRGHVSRRRGAVLPVGRDLLPDGHDAHHHVRGLSPVWWPAARRSSCAP